MTVENALKLLPILLEGIVATWWKSVKDNIEDWDSAVHTLRDAHSQNLPPHLVYWEIFAHKQRNNEATQLFVRNIRSVFAQLPYKIQETVKIDMVYGLLNRGIRIRVSRKKPTDIKVY